MTNFWLAMAVGSLLIAIYVIFQNGWQEGSMYLIFPVLAGMMYGIRKFMLKRLDRHNRSDD